MVTFWSVRCHACNLLYAPNLIWFCNLKMAELSAEIYNISCGTRLMYPLTAPELLVKSQSNTLGWEISKS